MRGEISWIARDHLQKTFIKSFDIIIGDRQVK